MVDHFYRLDDRKFEEMFVEGLEEMKTMETKLETQLIVVAKQRDRFKEVYLRMKEQINFQHTNNNNNNHHNNNMKDS